MKGKTKHKAVRKKRWLWLIFFLILLFLFLPLFLLFLYRFSFVHPVSTLMLRDIIKGHSYERQWVGLDAISPNLSRAVIMAEDGQFCAHAGVDWKALHSVIGNGGQRGASTILMQTTKNLFLWNGRSYVRKGLEIPLALSANFLLSKNRQLEIYLNIVEWGPNIYGAESAARHYFGHSAKTLSPHEAASLAAILPNPYMRNPVKPGKRLSQFIKLIEWRMARAAPYLKCLGPKVQSPAQHGTL